MLSNLVLPIICKKYNISCVLFSSDFKIVEYSKDLNELTNLEKDLLVNEDIREYFWEFLGMEEELSNIFTSDEKDNTINIPMVFKNNSYYDIDIETCLIDESQKLYIAMFTKQTKFSVSYSNMIQKLNHETLVFENKKESIRSNEYYYKLINKNLISFHVDADGIISEVNEACAFFFGYIEDEMIGHHFSTFFSTREQNATIEDEDIKIFHAKDLDDKDVFFHTDIIPINDGISIYKNIIICQDITYLKRVEAQLEYAVFHDSLTGLPNRSFLEDKLTKLIDANIDKKVDSFAICFLDLDKFKNINDVYGHHAGDMLLKHVGVILSSVIRENDTIARIGGDEFIILFENLENKDYLPLTLKRLKKLALDNPLCYTKDIIIPFDFSLGISIYPHDGQSIEKLLSYADKNMYLDKNSRN